MSDDRFLERLREDARSLRYSPEDESIWTRLPAKIRASLRSAPASTSQLLASWFRPIAASLTAIALVATMGLAWFNQPRDTTAPDTISANGVDIVMDGDLYLVGD